MQRRLRERVASDIRSTAEIKAFEVAPNCVGNVPQSPTCGQCWEGVTLVGGGYASTPEQAALAYG